MASNPAKVVPLPNGAARTEKQLWATWAEIDRTKAHLRTLEAKSRKLEREVGRDCGYFMPIGRENLALALLRKDGGDVG